MLNFKNKAAEKLYTDYACSSFEKINVQPGTCRYNYKCFYNAVHDAIAQKENNLVMVFLVGANGATLHFVNCNKKGIYTDNTLGYWATKYDYYFIRYVSETEFGQIGKIFDCYRTEMRRRLPFFIKLFSNATV